MGDRSDIVFNLSLFIIILVFLFRVIRGKLIKEVLIIENPEKEKSDKEVFYSVLLNIIASFSVVLLVLLVIELVSF